MSETKWIEVVRKSIAYRIQSEERIDSTDERIPAGWRLVEGELEKYKNRVGDVKYTQMSGVDPFTGLNEYTLLAEFYVEGK